MTKKEYILFKQRQAFTAKNNKQEKYFSINQYLKNLKRIINFIKLHKKSDKEANYEKMAFVEYKLNQIGYYSVCKQLHSKKHIDLIHLFEAQIKVINYIEKEGFISPEFQNVGLDYQEISDTCIILLNKGILKKRNCSGIAYEFNIPKT